MRGARAKTPDKDFESAVHQFPHILGQDRRTTSELACVEDFFSALHGDSALSTSKPLSPTLCECKGIPGRIMKPRAAKERGNRKGRFLFFEKYLWSPLELLRTTGVSPASSLVSSLFIYERGFSSLDGFFSVKT